MKYYWPKTIPMLLMDMIPKFIMPRVYMPKNTLASIYDPKKELVCKTLELPWVNNASNKSCIPEDTYIFIKMLPGAGRAYGYFRCAYVKGRTMNPAFNMSTILMHPGDHVDDGTTGHVVDSLGCIIVGSRHVDIENDGVYDMAESKAKLLWMYQNLPDAFYLEITKKAG